MQMGTNTASTPGSTISWMAASVAISTQRVESGYLWPSTICSSWPRISSGAVANCRRTSVMMARAPRSTESMVSAAKM